jgi:hypothetical protein
LNLSTKLLRESPLALGSASPPNPHSTTNALEDCPPHEMSYYTIKRLQYGWSLAQDSRYLRPHIPARVWMNWVQIGSASRNYHVLTAGRVEIE